MKINPEFVEYLNTDFTAATREALAERLQLLITDIPIFRFDDEISGKGNAIESFHKGVLTLGIKTRNDGTPYAVSANPNAIEAQADFYLSQEDLIHKIAERNGVTIQEVKTVLIIGAGCEVTVRSLLMAVNQMADDNERATIRKLATKRLTRKFPNPLTE